jgi:hypothetical protein
VTTVNESSVWPEHVKTFGDAVSYLMGPKADAAIGTVQRMQLSGGLPMRLVDCVREGCTGCGDAHYVRDRDAPTEFTIRYWPVKAEQE